MMLTKRRPHPTVHAFFASRLTYLPECFIVRHPGPCHCQARIARLSRQTPAGNLRQSDSFRRKDWVGNLLRIRKFKALPQPEDTRSRQRGTAAAFLARINDIRRPIASAGRERLAQDESWERPGIKGGRFLN